MNQVPIIPEPDPSIPLEKNWLADIWKQFTSLLYGLTGRDWRIVITGLSDWLMRQLFGTPVFRFSRVAPQLYVSGQYNKRGERRLRQEGINAVVNMRAEFSDEEAGIAPERYLHLSVIDNTPPTFEQLQQGVQFIRTEIEQGNKVYIHCAAGVGRAPTMAAAYLISQGLSTDAAWKTIQSVRPFIRPTLAQREQIKQFEVRLKTLPQ